MKKFLLFCFWLPACLGEEPQGVEPGKAAPDSGRSFSGSGLPTTSGSSMIKGSDFGKKAFTAPSSPEFGKASMGEKQASIGGTYQTKSATLPSKSDLSERSAREVSGFVVPSASPFPMTAPSGFEGASPVKEYRGADADLIRRRLEQVNTERKLSPQEVKDILNRKD